jgi:hypothetical protein
VRGELVAAAPRAGPVIEDRAPPAAEPSGPAAEGQAVMPRLTGLSLRHALEALAPFGVRLEVTGGGVVTGQSPAPGTPLAAGALCRLHLAPPRRPAPRSGDREPPAVRS